MSVWLERSVNTLCSSVWLFYIRATFLSSLSLLLHTTLIQLGGTKKPTRLDHVPLSRKITNFSSYVLLSVCPLYITNDIFFLSSSSLRILDTIWRDQKMRATGYMFLWLEMSLNFLCSSFLSSPSLLYTALIQLGGTNS